MNELKGPGGGLGESDYVVRMSVFGIGVFCVRHQIWLETNANQDSIGYIIEDHEGRPE